MAENKPIITLVIDSSSSVSGLALFRDKKLMEHIEVEHKLESIKNLENPNAFYDMNQKLIDLYVSNLLIKYLGLTGDNASGLNVVIEIPRGSYTNNHTYGRLMLYAGL